MSIAVKEQQVLFLAQEAINLGGGGAPCVRESLNLLLKQSRNAAVADKARQMLTKIPKEAANA